MKIDDLRVGARVHCPADRNDPAFTGRVVSFGSDVSKTLNGTEYVWVTVQTAMLHKSVWPSNRLG